MVESVVAMLIPLDALLFEIFRLRGTGALFVVNVRILPTILRSEIVVKHITVTALTIIIQIARVYFCIGRVHLIVKLFERSHLPIVVAMFWLERVVRKR